MTTTQHIREKLATTFPGNTFSEETRNQIADFFLSLRSQELKEIAEEIEKLINKPKGYDGDNLKEAGDFYSIAAQSFSEVIRCEQGMSKAFHEVLTIINSHLTE